MGKEEVPGARGGCQMANAMYLRKQAQVLLHLSRATMDLGIAARLRALAAEFEAKADELEDDEDFSPWPPRRRDSPAGKMDRD
jgi:hypothetical protein